MIYRTKYNFIESEKSVSGGKLRFCSLRRHSHTTFEISRALIGTEEDLYNLGYNKEVLGMDNGEGLAGCKNMDLTTICSRPSILVWTHRLPLHSLYYCIYL